MADVHDFNEDLEYSSTYDALFNECYTAIFPDIQDIVHVDIALQRKGIDKELIFKDRVHLYVEEKTRKKVWPDILLERWSSEKRPGWIITSEADLFAYLFAPIQKICLFDMKLLKAAWENNEEQWISTYFKSEALNYNYTTIGYCIPLKVLFLAVESEKC